jgi:[NiFe] hydrogenase assembly HybE family chaperone
VNADATAGAAQSRLRTTFERIAHERMAGLPFLNPRLQVEAFGFRAWQGALVGALVTPWSINLVIMPRTPEPKEPATATRSAQALGPSESFRALASGQSQRWSFPSGSYEFHGHDEPGLGPYQQCSLFSPAQEFAAQQDAREAASAALEELFREPLPRPPVVPARVDAPAGVTGAAGLSRRQLLFGAGRAATAGVAERQVAAAPVDGASGEPG